MAQNFFKAHAIVLTASVKFNPSYALAQLLDSIFWLDLSKTQSLNHTFNTHPLVVYLISRIK